MLLQKLDHSRWHQVHWSVSLSGHCRVHGKFA
jgi:hypothetical protein